MLNLLNTISFFGIELDWDESSTMTYLLIAIAVLFVITLVVMLLLILRTRPANNENAFQPVTVTVEPLVATETAETNDEPAESVNSADVIATLETANVDESENGAVVHAADGTEIYYSYHKSFVAKLIQARDEVKEYYNEIKNFVLSYPKVKAKMSWKQERFSYGKEKVCWFVLRGKSLYLYLPLNPDDYAESKYKVERDNAKRYEEVPCLYKITNARRSKYAMELIETVMARLGVERSDKSPENFVADYPYRSTITLIKKGLIKVTESKHAFSSK